MILNRKMLYLLLALIVAAALFFVLNGGDAKEDETEAGTDEKMYNPLSEKPAEKRSAVRVKAAKVFTGDLVKRVTAYGNAEAVMRVTITPETVGKILSVNVKEGDRVKKGEVLFRLSSAEARLRLEGAKNAKIQAYSRFLVQEMDYRGELGDKRKRLRRTEKNWKDAQERYKEGLISKEKYDEAERVVKLTREAAKLSRDEVVESTTGLTKAKIDLKTAELDIEKTICRAPFAGVVTGIEIVPGQQVTGSTEAMILVNYSSIKIVAEVLENEIAALKPGKGVRIDLLAVPGKTFEGKIASISPIIDTEKKTGKAIIYINNPEHRIKPGMYARVRLDSYIFSGRLLVPRASVIERDGKKLVFIIKDGRAKWEYIRTGLENEEYIEVIPDPGVGVHGVHEGDDVLIEGHISLSHDTKVKM